MYETYLSVILGTTYDLAARWINNITKHAVQASVDELVAEAKACHPCCCNCNVAAADDKGDDSKMA